MTQRATLRDIAMQAGVSAVTVHKALYAKKGVGDTTRNRILDIAAKIGYSVNEAASSLKRKPVHIAVILQSISNPQNFFFRKMWDGIDRVERSLSDYRVRITRFECGDNWQSQEEILLGILRQGDVDGAILHCWDETKLNAAINLLFERGIPVVTVNADAIGSKRVACVSAPNQRVGSLAAEVLTRLMGENTEKRVILAGGDRSVENASATRKGFVSEMHNLCPQTEITEICNDRDREKFKRDLTEALRNPGETKGIYAITARDTCNTCEVVQNLGLSEKITVVGSDAFEEMKAFFENHTLDAAIWKDHQFQAEHAVMLLYQYISGRPLSLEPVRLGIIMRSNLEDYL
jgi:LacI family transcriptional regulator